MKKGWLYYLNLSVFLTFMMYILICGIGGFGNINGNSYLEKAAFIIFAVILWILLKGSLRLLSHFRVYELLERHKKGIIILECILVILILGVSVFFRCQVIFSDISAGGFYQENFYYQAARFWSKQPLLTENSIFCDYLSMFPQYFLYAAFVTGIFRLAGGGVYAVLLLQLFFAVMMIFFTYRMARRLAGKLAAMIALVIAAFWPSAIFYHREITPEYLAACLTIAIIYLFLGLNSYEFDFGNKGRKLYIGVKFLQYLLLGGLTACLIVLKPVCIVIAVAFFVYLSIYKKENTKKEKIRYLFWIVSVSAAVLIIIILSYTISYKINRKLPLVHHMAGYQLLVGFNESSAGMENTEDAALWKEIYEDTGDADETQRICGNLAAVRISQNPFGMIDLALRKLEYMWGNDEYALSTAESYAIGVENRKLICNAYYFLCIVFSVLSVFYLWKNKGEKEILAVFIINALIIGTSLFEAKNVNHFPALMLFAVLAASAVSFMRKEYERNIAMQELEMSEENCITAEAEAMEPEAAEVEAAEAEVIEPEAIEPEIKGDTVTDFKAISEEGIVVSEEIEQKNIFLQKPEEVKNLFDDIIIPQKTLEEEKIGEDDIDQIKKQMGQILGVLEKSKIPIKISEEELKKKREKQIEKAKLAQKKKTISARNDLQEMRQNRIQKKKRRDISKQREEQRNTKSKL